MVAGGSYVNDHEYPTFRGREETMSVKVISRDEVEINGEKWKRSYFESMSRVTPTGGNSACSKVGAVEILRLMDACEEPKESILKTNTSADHTEPTFEEEGEDGDGGFRVADMYKKEPSPKWQPGMWAEVIEGRQKGYRFKVCDVSGFEPFLRDETEIPNWWFNGTSCTPVPPPKEEKPSQVFYGGCTNTGAVETSEKPENPFTGPHWQEENFTKDIVFNAWRRDCDLRDELNRIRKLLAGKSVTP